MKSITKFREEKASEERINLLISIEKEKSAIRNEAIKTQAYLNLNDLYLNIQTGKVKLTRTIYHQLNDLLNGMFAGDNHLDPMRAWWWAEFQKLPGWIYV